ncbi:MAG: D-gamma-glutamyl-meso-diaminopimelic acid endopeptidase CwlS [Chlamydiae bacterium]|nr:D-gamma-glutamyl-meso-diaminopimelic acid endopeptidase CwlS [Chlamydiota bacterium]
MKGRREIEKLIRRLRQTLIVSGVLNILLFTFIFYTWFSPKTFDIPNARPFEPALTNHTSSGQLMLECYQMPFQQLVTRLEDREAVECGYSQRDFALACLVAKYYFDVPRALHGTELQERLITFHGQEHLGTFPLYPGLNHQHYESIIAFAKTEKWPFTSEGLFFRMQQHQAQIPRSLASAFMMTEEFKTLHKRFPDRNPLEIVRLMLDVSWKTCLATLDQSSPEQTLLEFLHAGSSTSAQIFLESDFLYAVRKLDDGVTLRIFELLGETHPLAQKYAKHILETPRGDAVWQLARMQVAEPAREKREMLYVVQEGDSLWKIARLHGIQVDELKSCNQLESDRICPGKILKIP